MRHKINALLFILVIFLFSVTAGKDIYQYFVHTLNQLQSNAVPPVKESTQIRYRLDLTEHSAPPAKLNKSTQKHNVEKTAIPRHQCNRPVLADMTDIRRVYANKYDERRYKTVKKYYELNTNLGSGYESFISELKGKLDGAFQHFEKQLGVSLTKTMTLDMVFKTSRQDYEDYVINLGASPTGNQGLYQHSTGIAIIQMKTHEQGINTAIHEAMHAFGHAYWGDALSFFSEGISEYFEAINLDGTVSMFDFSYIKHQSHPMKIPSLLFSETDWHSNQTLALYQNSKALFHFLMSNEEGRKVILNIIRLELKQPCTELPVETILKVLTDTYPNHEQEFYYWFSDNLYVFNEKSINH